MMDTNQQLTPCSGTASEAAMPAATAELSALRHRAKAMVASYFASWGVQDPDVLSVITRRMLQRAESKLESCGPDAYRAQLNRVAIECSDAYVEAWITSFEKQIDLHGGNSRCAELAVRLPMLLKQYPDAILSTDAASEVTRAVVALSMPAQPPNNPTKFAAQPLLGDRPPMLAAAKNWIANRFRREQAVDL